MQGNQDTRHYVDSPLQIEKLAEGGPLGFSDANLGQWIFPQITLIKLDSRGVTFQKTTAQIGTLTAYLPEPKAYHVGNFFTLSLEGDTIGAGSINFRNLKLPESVHLSQKVLYEIDYQITSEAYTEIKLGEAEHLADFERAFELTLKRVADEINRLAGEVYQDSTKAVQKLTEALQNTPQLIPQDPYTLDTWKPHLLDVLDALTSQSVAYRDKAPNKDHSAKAYKVTISGTKLTLIPQFNNPHRKSSDIITLENIQPISNRSQVNPPITSQITDRAAILTPGRKAILNQQIKSAKLYKEESTARNGGKETAENALNPRTLVSIVTVMPKEQVLVSFDAQTKSGVDADVFDAYEVEKFYIIVNSNQLSDYLG